MTTTQTLYHSKTKNQYFLVPETIELQEGDFLIETLNKIQRNVSYEAIKEFEISAAATTPFFQKELNNAIEDFADFLGIKTEKKAPTETQSSCEKIVEGITGEKYKVDVTNTKEILKDFGKAIQVVWEDVLSEAEDSPGNAVQKLKVIRKDLAEKGVNLNDDFEAIPLEWKDSSLHESVLELKTTTTKLKADLTELFKDFETKKEGMG